MKEVRPTVTCYHTVIN